MPKDEFDPEDPMELCGVGLVTDEDTTDAMAECFIEEFMRLGYNHKQVLGLFRNPFYIGVNMVLQNRGEPFVRDCIAEVFARWGKPVTWPNHSTSPPHEPTPYPSQEGNWQERSSTKLPSWEGLGVGSGVQCAKPFSGNSLPAALSPEEMEHRVLPDVSGPNAALDALSPAHEPTPSPLPGGELANGVSNEAPLLGGAGGGFTGAMRDYSSGRSLPAFSPEEMEHRVLPDVSGPNAALDAVSPAHEPTPSPLPGGELANGVSNEAPFLGGPGGGFTGAIRDNRSGRSLPQVEGQSKGGRRDPAPPACESGQVIELDPGATDPMGCAIPKLD